MTKLSCKCRKKKEEEKNKLDKIKDIRKKIIVCTVTYLPSNSAQKLTW